MTETKRSIPDRLSRTIGLFRGLFLPFGLFAIVAIGIHAGSDCVDDHSFVLYNFLDAGFDRFLTWSIMRVYGLLDVSVQTTAAHTFHAIDFIDLEAKDAAARWTALFVELGADVIFAIPIFRHRPDGTSIRMVLHRTFKDFTVLRVVGPLAAVLASVSGALVVAREIQVAVHGTLAHIGPGARYADEVASVMGVVALVLVAWRLGGSITRAAARWADRRAEKDRAHEVPIRARRLRGIWTAAIILPITFLAVFQATPVVATLRALWPL